MYPCGYTPPQGCSQSSNQARVGNFEAIVSPHHERMQNDVRQLDRKDTYTNGRTLDGSQVTDMKEYTQDGM